MLLLLLLLPIAQVNPVRVLDVKVYATQSNFPGRIEMNYWATAKPNYRALLNCIAFTFNQAPPYRRTSIGYGGGGVKNSDSFAKRVTPGTYTVSVGAYDRCGGGRGGAETQIVIQ